MPGQRTLQPRNVLPAPTSYWYIYGWKRGAQPGTPEARRGGQSVRAKYGVEFYTKLGKMGGEAVKAQRGREYFAEIGRKGGRATKQNRGSEHYAQIGRQGGRKRGGSPEQSAG